MKFNEPNNQNEERGLDTSTSISTSMTSGGSANTKGSWTDIGATTSFDYNAITFCFANGHAAEFMFDFGVSDGSNRWNLISDLHLPFVRQANESYLHITLPLYVPAGSQLSGRVAASSSSLIAAVNFIGHASGLGGAPGFSKCVTLFSPSSSRGVAVDAGGSANTKGSWAQIIASTPEDVKAMFAIVGQNGDVSRAATSSALIDIGVGAGGSEFVLYPDAFVSWGTTADGPINNCGIPVFACDVPAGSRIAGRMQANTITAGDRTIDIALYGFA